MFLRIFVSSLLLALSSQAADDHYRRSGDDHFYNLEYDEAIQDYTKLIQENPADPLPYNDLAAAHLYKELFRLGMLDSTALGKNNGFLHQRPQADPQAEKRFRATLDQGQRAAEAKLAANARDENALYALCSNYSLRANYEFMLQKSWFAALRSGARAKEYCEGVLKRDPNYVDAYLMPGIMEYTVGSLPLPVRLFAHIGGIHGSKKNGIALVTRVAREGNYDRDNARVILAVLYRRERRPLDAARIVEGLLKDYPRNYLFRIELASMYQEAGETQRASYAFATLLQQHDLRMPPAVRREVESIEARLLPGSAARQTPVTSEYR